jgi:hypothetical protein
MQKLAIVGTGTETRDDAPWDDPEFDIWVFNEAAQSEWCKRWDACFQMHRPEIYSGHNTKNHGHWGWLQEKRGKPIYMQAFDERVPDCKIFPLQDAISLAGGLRYLTATVCDALALARLKAYEQVDLYGIELSMSEYQYHAECYRFWIGLLMGAGVKVNLYSGAYLFDALLYGYEGNFALGADYFAGRVHENDSGWQRAEKRLQNVKKLIERAIGGNDFDKLPDLLTDLQEIASACGEYAGAQAEAERYQAFGDRLADRGGFEYAAAKSQRDGEAKRALMFATVGKAEYVWNIWKQTKSPAAANQLLAFCRNVANTAYETGAHLGMYQENVHYIMDYDARVKANGGASIASVPMQIAEMTHP